MAYQKQGPACEEFGPGSGPQPSIPYPQKKDGNPQPPDDYGSEGNSEGGCTKGGYPKEGFSPPITPISRYDPEINHHDFQQFQFSDKAIRMAFIRKVYGILMIQLLITFGLVALFVLSEDLKGWSRANPGYIFVAFGLCFAIIIILSCCEDVRRKAPGNLICLAIFTIAEGFMVGMFCSVFKVESVLLAIGITTVVCLALTAFSFQTKWDFTTMSGILLVILIAFFHFGILMIFLPRTTFPTLHIVYASLGALLFSFYLVVDTQLMMGGNHMYSISPEEYILAALHLYLDIMNLFIRILYILGLSSN